MIGKKTLSPSPVRLPDDLKTWLKHRAVDNKRSLNSEVVSRLEESRRREQQAQGAQQ